MRTESSLQKREDKKEYPPDLQMSVDQSVVFIPIDARHVDTKYGERIVCSIVIRGAEEDVKTWWWKSKHGIPALNMPMHVKRLPDVRNKPVYDATFPENEAEAKTLWMTGELPRVEEKGKGANALKEILSRFKS